MSFWQDVAQDYGAEFATKLEELRTNPRYSEYVSILEPSSQMADAQQGARQVLGIFSSQAPIDYLPQGLRAIFGGVSMILGHKEYLRPEKVPSRPREEYLIEGGEAFARALEQASQKMTNVKVDVKQFRSLLGLIVLSRHIVKPFTRFGTALINNLSVVEDQLYQTMKEGYDLIRPVAQLDLQLNEILEMTEYYLYGPAKQAAETTKDNKAKAAEIQSDVEKKVKLAAKSEARNLIADEVVGFLESMRAFIGKRDEDEPQSDDRRNPR